MLNVNVRREEGIPVVRLEGRLDGLGATEFDKATRELRGAPGCERWVVDFADVDYLSSAGIRALVSAEKALRAAGGRLLLAGVNPMIESVLDASGLLREFLVAESVCAALASAGEAAPAGEAERRDFAGLDFELTPLAGEPPLLEWWGAADWMARRAAGAEPRDLVAVRLSELGFTLGVGGLGANMEQAVEGLGEFLAAGGVMGVAPADGHGEPDFAITARPEAATAWLAAGISLRGAPSARLQAARPGGGAFTLAELGRGIAAWLAANGDAKGPAVAGFALACETRRLVRETYSTPAELSAGAGKREEAPSSAAAGETRFLFVIGVVGDAARLMESASGSGEAGAEGAKLLAAYLRHGACETGEAGAAGGPRIHAHAFHLLSAPPDHAFENPQSAARAIADPERLLGALHLAPGTALESARGWLFLPSAIRPGAEGRLRIEWPRDYSHPGEWDSIVRQIYSDASRVTMSPLHGGFTATTLQVAAYDTAGRQMLPTVLKLGGLEMGRREENACREFVQKYILNNGTMILGTAAQGKYIGLRYNFVGISGPESRLTWLREHYMRRPSAELIPLFDRIFTGILKPWYGQPRWERVRLFEEHTPARDLFPHLLEDAQSELGVSPDEPELRCPFIERPLPNPYHALAHVYPARRGESTLWYTAINHGDLNMQNILLDERENIYIIDFSETRPRNLVSDFARLEPIFLFETLRLDTDEDLRHAVGFAERLLAQKSLAATPEFAYAGKDPMVRKAYDLILRLRHYANVVTLFETQMAPYWLAMLQWTLPVASYRGIAPRRKQLALYTSALLCEQVLR